MIKNSSLQLNQMKKARLTHERFFAQLRFNEISNLGEVQRVYLEAKRQFSIWRSDDEIPGLNFLPDWDIQYHDQKLKPVSNLFACGNCGQVQQSEEKPTEICKNCRNCFWRQAVLNKGNKDQSKKARKKK